MGLTTTTRKMRYAHLFCGLFYLLSCPQICLSKKTIDLESYDCTHQVPFFISDTELVSVMARPRVDILSRTKCIIHLEAQPNRYFNIYLHDIDIGDCGTTLEFFDKDASLRYPFKTFGCHTSPGALFNTRTNILTITLRKISSAATRYRIQIELATNKGPKLGVGISNHSKKQPLTLTALCTILLISWLII